MKNYTKIVYFLLLVIGCQSNRNFLYLSNSDSGPIQIENIKANLEFLASDALEGRETGTRGETLAALYISSELKKYGIQPFDANGYAQWFDLISFGFNKNSKFTLMDEDGNELDDFEYGSDFVGSAKYAASLDTITSLFFAGYGISAEKYGYDDYADIDVSGKVVLLYYGEPESTDSSFFEGSKDSPYASSLSKMMNAKDHGAVGAIILSKWEKEFGWDKIVSYMNKGILRLQDTTLAKPDKKFPIISINEGTLEEILSHAPYSYQDLIDILINGDELPKFELDYKIDIDWSVGEQGTVKSRNIIAVIEGSDPHLKYEFVAIGAHYDHIGMSAGEVYNGADDNASGTSAILEAANALTLSAENKRSILVVFHSAEEKGLLGSKYLTQNLSILDNIIAYINLDMVGRGASDSIYSIGSDKISKKFHQLIEQINSETVAMNFNYKFDDPDDPKRYYYRSDHYNYAKHGIPTVFLFDNAMEDYHKITDDADKINYEKLAKIAELTYNFALHLANMDERFELDELVSR
jgi:hypothetical protein